MNDMITARDRDRISALHCTEQNIASQRLCDTGNCHSVQTKFRENFKFQQFHTASGKSVDFDGRRETKETGNLLCCCQFRVDDHGNAKTLLDEANFIGIDRITDTGDGVTVSCFLSNQTAEKVHLIRTCNCDQNIGILNAGFHQSVDTCSVSYDSHCVDIVFKGIDHIRRNIDQCNIGLFFLKLLSQGTSDFSASNNNYLHKSSNKISSTPWSASEDDWILLRNLFRHARKISVLDLFIKNIFLFLCL